MPVGSRSERPAYRDRTGRTNANFAGSTRRFALQSIEISDGRCGMTRSWIHFTRGRFVRQARVGLGELREEHLSRQGFAGPVAMIYRESGPNEVVRVEGEYRRREIDSADVVSSDAADPRGSWQVLLANEDVAVAISRRREAMPYRFRNLDGDLLYFAHRVTGVFATEFGPIRYEPGDY